MKVLITDEEHPQHGRVATLTGFLPASVLTSLSVEPQHKGKGLFAIEFGGGQRGTAFEGQLEQYDPKQD